MTDTAAETHSATSSEATEGSKDNKDTKAPTICEAFSSPAGNVFFKSPDDIIFRVEDFYLKANRLHDFEILLLVIVGRGEEAAKRVTTWKQAEKLYRMGDKYQIDGPRLWFSRICVQCAAEKPWDALFLACNVSPMNTDIIRQAISEGFDNFGIDELCESRYFEEMKSRENGSKCWTTIRISNITTLFGLELGLLGLLAYRLTFNAIYTGSGKGREWESWAKDFVKNVKAVEKARDIKASATE